MKSATGRKMVNHSTTNSVSDMPDPEDAGKALYEERQKLLEGLWMPAAPFWDDLPEETKERWRSHAAGNDTSGVE